MEKKLVYLVCCLNYGFEVSDNLEIIGIYDTKEKARNKFKELVKKEMNSNNNMVLDNECENEIEKGNLVRFFFERQENWDDYYEIEIKELEVK